MKLTASLVGVVFLVALSAYGLSIAGSWMTAKSDFSFFAGLALGALIVAGWIALVVKIVRIILNRINTNQKEM